MGIKLTAFMTAYKFRKSDEEKEKFVLEHMKNEYVPLEKKSTIAKAIMDTCCWRKNEDGTQDLHVDSVAKYMTTCMAMVDLYTTIERNKNNMLVHFNTLNQYGVLDLIVKNIDQRELKEFNMVLEMTYDDVMTNEYENHAYITKQVNRFGTLIGATLSPILSNLDIDKIEEIIKGFG